MDMQSFTDKLIEITARELGFWRGRFAFENMRVFNMGCHPWHGSLEPSFLTTQELFDEATYGKWAIGDWRLYHFTETWNSGWPQASSLEEWMAQQYDDSDDPRAMAEEFFVACAKAITSEQVMNELRQYTLAPDFEVSVFNPDDPGPRKNYCHR
jgi:hypothetical protein